MVQFFIDRPIFAWVLAFITMLAGVIGIYTLPISQYPNIAPPSVTVTAIYPGASAQALENSVTQVIEQQMKGLDGLLYMNTVSESTGIATLTLTFSADTDPDIAQVQVQNKLQLAIPVLPQEVQRQGIVVDKAAQNFAMVVGFVSDDGTMSTVDIADYVAANLLDQLSRVQGVGHAQLFGSQYAMRIWLDPNKLNRYSLTPQDVRQAILDQNAQVSLGEFGAIPAVEGQQLNATITGQDRLTTVAQFQKILLKVNEGGGTVQLKDVARVEIGAQSYALQPRYNGKPAAGVAIKLASGANVIETATLLQEKLEDLKPFFPPHFRAVIPFNTTPFVERSIHEVVKTLLEAIGLVFLVMLLFLQNIRATLIPTIAVPVVLLGTFAILSAAGFSINMLTMFAMVLAIGLLVDDAIVVVENVERVMQEEGLSPREATKKSMHQITGALIGIVMVLSAVFVPMAFFSGSTGVIYRQFSVTIISAMVLSLAVALILTPALCGSLLKPNGHQKADSKLFGWFNRGFKAATRRYESIVGHIIARVARYAVIYAVLVAIMAIFFIRLPTAFLPDEDQGFIMAMAQLPAGATLERTEKIMKKMEDYFLNEEKDTVEALFTVAGFSFAGQGQNSGMAFVNLYDWSERDKPSQAAGALAGRAMGYFFTFRDAMAFAFQPPAVMQLGDASGFDFYLQDRGGLGHETLMNARNQLLGMAAQNPKLVGVRPNGQSDTPQYNIAIDRQKAKALGLNIDDINATLSMAWGSSYVNDFIDRGRVKKVYIQADAPFRMLPGDLDLWHVRNDKGDMVPFSAFASGEWSYGSPRLERFNGFPAMQILGAPAPGVSSGEAMVEIEKIIAKLPNGIGFDWSGLSYQEKASGSQTTLLYTLSILMVFLCLAALYESWSVPVSILMVVPIGVVGALGAAMLRGMPNDVYFQVGLLTTIGLAAKNAILIVEFGLAQQEHGKSLIEATKIAVRQRLRPILMTSLAFMLGVLPLALASGAGSGSQNAIGTGVVGGMLSATVLGIFFIPLFFVIIRRLFKGPAHSVEHRIETGD